MFAISRRRKLKLYHTVEKSELDAITKKLSARKDSRELFYAYYALIIESVCAELDVATWGKLTKAQQVVATLGQFSFQVNNGGIWQFFFNRTELAIAMAEASDTTTAFIGYSTSLGEFIAMVNSGEFDELLDRVNNSESEEERWEAFKSGEAAIKSSKKFERYFFSKEGIDFGYEKINRYIEQNLGSLLKVTGVSKTKTNKKNVSKIKKKDAVPHFTQYLTEAYGEAPVEVSIYYTGRCTIDNTPTQLFLMKFKLADGYESIGITGDFTRHFPDVPLSEINQMYKKYHKQELVNIHYGTHLVETAIAQGKAETEIDPKLWKKFLAKIQAPKQSQVPVNVELIGYLKMKGLHFVIYNGDLMYNEPNNFPVDLNNVEVTFDEKRSEGSYRGEANLTFHANPTSSDFGGRASRKTPVVSKYKLGDIAGSKFKLMKDNPWGF